MGMECRWRWVGMESGWKRGGHGEQMEEVWVGRADGGGRAWRGDKEGDLDK